MCGICGCWYTPIKYKVRTGEYKRKLCCAGRLRKGREKCTAQRISFDKIRVVFLMTMLDHIVVCDDNKFDVILRSERVIHIVV